MGRVLRKRQYSIRSVVRSYLKLLKRNCLLGVERDERLSERVC
jgi:hypothetical protein